MHTTLSESRILLSVFALILWITACGDSRSISYERAIEISRKTAEQNGYDLNKYALDTFGDPTGGGNEEWLIGYHCSPEPPRPGCAFLVAVDRRTGNAQLYRGQ
jgi:hypothetical protein